MRSAIYVGTVAHVRLAPVPHAFRTRLRLFYLDLAELDAALGVHPALGHERRAWASFRRADHLGHPHRPLDESVRDLVEERSGVRPRGPIALLTALRRIGWLQNPVSLYYCFDTAGHRVEAVVAEVTNTPWHEREAYVLRRTGAGLSFRARKALHVSPFMAMEQDYAFELAEPDRALAVRISNLEAGRPIFHASFEADRRPLSRAEVTRLLVRDPLGPIRTSAAIYGHALRLALRGAPFHAHPGSRTAEAPR
jgi:uncharacterized protein